jgi:H+/gluconate symporter-like permease
MMGLFAIVLALALLMYLAYRGFSLLVLAPLMALLAAGLGGSLPLLGSYTQVYMREMGGFIISFFPLFLLGAVFGKLMDDSGSARSIAAYFTRLLGKERAILAVVVCCAILTYGGVSLFVVAFAIFPVAASLFRDANIPKRLIPAALALGSFTFTMSALPGTPAIQNAIPMPFFGTTAFAAPVLGIIAACLMFGLGMVWLNRRSAQARAAGEGYGNHSDALSPQPIEAQEGALRDGFDLRAVEDDGAASSSSLPSFAIAATPVALVVIVNLVFVEWIVPRLDSSFLSEPRFGSTTIESVQGLWAIIVSLTVAILFIIAVNWPRFGSLRATIDEGANASVIPIANTASLVGFGAVIAIMPAFQSISDAMLALGSFNPLVSLAISVTTLSALTGSASGGMSIALDNLGANFVDLADSAGISLEAMHRISSISSGTLDALPHNGAVITVLGISKLGHNEAYGDMFVVAVVIPMISLVGIILLESLL